MTKDPSTAISSLGRVLAAGLVCLLFVACHETPSEPRDTILPPGRWSGDGACLSVTPDHCDLIAGCGHGQFPAPTVRTDGTFEVDGTYRLEAGPVGIDPASPATFSGVLKGQTLTLNVMPRGPSLQPATFELQPTNAPGKCAAPCV